MARSFIVDLNNIEDLRNFVNEVSHSISSDVDATYGRQNIDAKSLLGLITIVSHPIEISINSDNPDEIAAFEKICEQYEVK